MSKQIVLSSFIFCMLPCISQTKNISCRINGNIIDYPECTQILIYKERSDLRIDRCDTINVADGHFYYNLTTNDTEPVYELCPANEYVSGSWRNAIFFAEDGIINITINKGDKGIIVESGAPLNAEYLKFEKEAKKEIFDNVYKLENLLEEHNLMYTQEALELRKQMHNTDNKQILDSLNAKIRQLAQQNKINTPASVALEAAWEEAFRRYNDKALAYAETNITPVGLYLLKKSTYIVGKAPEETVISKISDIINNHYIVKYPNHPTGKYINNWISSHRIKPGGRFIDFTAPDLYGKNHTLSNEISGKVALIDFWASWCGSCRTLSKSMIPIYELYKNRGFTIVGIARERDADNMKKAIVKDGYPWLNLIELRDRAQIWDKYGIGQSGGSTVLVDRQGKILAIRPSAEEVKAFLEKEL